MTDETILEEGYDEFWGEYRWILDSNGEKMFEFSISLPEDEYDFLCELACKKGFTNVSEFAKTILIEYSDYVINFREQFEQISDEKENDNATL